MLIPNRNPRYERCLLEEMRSRAKVRYLKGRQSGLIKKAILLLIRFRLWARSFSHKSWFSMNLISRGIK